MLSDVYANDADVNQLMRKSVQDSSYSVMETAIMHIMEDNSTEGLALIKSMEKDENENIRQIVTDFYKLYGSDDQFEYMTVVLEETKGYSKYAVVQNYGKFLLRCQPANALKGIDYIGAVGSSHPQWFVRLSAVQTLSEIAKSYGKSSTRPSGNEIIKPGDQVLNDRQEIENTGVRKKAEDLLNDIKSKEEDPNLTKIYHKNQ